MFQKKLNGPYLFHQLGEVKSWQRRLLGWLQNHSASSRKCWANFPGSHEDGIVPWDDGRNNTDWLLPGDAQDISIWKQHHENHQSLHGVVITHRSNNGAYQQGWCCHESCHTNQRSTESSWWSSPYQRSNHWKACHCQETPNWRGRSC